MEGWMASLDVEDTLGHFKRWNRFADKRVQFMTVLGAGHFSKAIFDQAASRAQKITPTHDFTYCFCTLQQLQRFSRSECKSGLHSVQTSLWITLTRCLWITLRNQSLVVTAYIQTFFPKCTFLVQLFIMCNVLCYRFKGIVYPKNKKPAIIFSFSCRSKHPIIHILKGHEG